MQLTRPRDRRWLLTHTALTGVALATALVATPAFSQDATWSATPGSANWNTSGNWVPTTVPTGTATFGASNTTSLTLSQNTTTIGTIQFNAGAPAYSFGLTVNEALRVGALGVVNSSSNRPTFTVDATSILQFLNASSAGNAKIDSSGLLFFIGQSTGGTAQIIQHAGPGVFDMSGLTTAGMTAGSIEGDGQFDLGSKKLTVGGNNLSTSVTGRIEDGGTFGTPGDHGSLEKVGTGTLTLSTANSYSGGTTLTTGTIAVGNNSALGTGTLTIAGILQSGAAGLTIGNAITIGAGGFGKFDTNGNTFTLSGVISGGDGSSSLAKSGTGTLVLSGTNTYAGGTTVDTGTLQLGNNAALGTGGLLLSDGTTLQSGAAGLTVGNAITIAGGGSATIDTNGNTFTLSSGISGNAASVLIKSGVGTLILTNTNTYSGGTTINNGTLQIGDSTHTGAIVGAVTNNSTLDFVKSDNTGITTVANNGGSVNFRNATSAESTTLTNTGGTVNFLNIATAGNATIVNNSGGTTAFGALGGTDTSNAGTSHITNNNTGTTNFFADSSAMNTTIANNSGGNLNLRDQSTAGNATIVNNSGGTTTFGVSGTDTASAGNSVIINNSGGTTAFFAATTAGSSTIINSLGGIVQFGGSGGANDTATAGSSTIDNSGVFSFNSKTTAGTSTITTHSGGNVFFFDTSSGGGARFITDAGGTVDISALTSAGTTAGSIEGAGSYVLGAKNFAVGSNNLSTEVSGVISGVGGSLTKVGAGTLILSGTNTYTSGTTISAGTLQLGNGGTTGSIAGDIVDNATLAVNRSNAMTLGGVISGSGAFRQIGLGTTTLTNTNVYTGLTTVTAGTLALTGTGSIASSSGLNLTGTFDISGTAAGSTITTLAGSGAVALGARTLSLSNALGSTFSGAIGGSGGGLTLAGGTEVLSGANTYTGATAVNAGTLTVNGSIASSSGLTINNGGTVGGTGTLSTTIVNAGGKLAPGNSIGTIAVSGNVTFNAGGIYAVEFSPTTADRTNVTGTVTLNGGTVQATALSGSFHSQTYTIVNATGGVTGAFAGLTVTGAALGPQARNPHLTYDANDVYLVLDPGTIQLPAGAGGNAAGVAGGINNAVLAGATPAAGFNTLLNLSGTGLINALQQLSGEAATGGQQASFQSMNGFLGAMFDQMTGFGGVGTSTGGAIGFAPEQPALPEDVAMAYAAVLKAPAAAPISFAQRWHVWGSAYGGYNKTTGDTMTVGSHDLTARAYGFAAGMDYRLTADTTVGFSLAGGGTNWGLSDGLGSGRSDTFNAGLYGIKRLGPSYIAAALAFGNQWMSTDRFASGGDHLTANFNAQSYGGRLEGGRRYAMWAMGVTPYAAVQTQWLRTPSYAENDLTGGGFALSFAARTANATRTELGTRFDKPMGAKADMQWVLSGKLAWAHDWTSDPTASATFQALPGAGFIVNGAAPARDLALVSAGSEIRMKNGITLLAKFDGEFASRSTTYSGNGTVRYNW